MRKRVFFVFLLIVVSVSVAAQNTPSRAALNLNYFTVVEQFSSTANPNGAWRYGFTKKLGGPFIPYTISGDCNCPEGYVGWYGPYRPPDAPPTPMAAMNQDTTPNHSINLQPGPNGTFSVARWVASSSGRFDIVASFFGFGAGGSDVHILKNGSSIYNDTLVQNDFKWTWPTVDVVRGDRIDFVVGQGSDGNYVDDSTWLQAMISPHVYDYVVFDPPGSINTGAWRINNLGDVVGHFSDNAGVFHAYMRDHTGKFTTFDYPSAALTLAYGINDWGEVVGAGWDSTGTISYGYRWKNGKFTPVTFPGAVRTVPYQMNDLGDIAGVYDTGGAADSFGFLLRHDGKAISFEVPGSAPATTEVYGINNLGQIVGRYKDMAGVYHAYQRSAQGVFSDLSFPSANSTSAWDLNDWQMVIAHYADGPAWNEAYLQIGTRYLPFWLPNAGWTAGHGINNLGTMVGSEIDYVTNVPHGFIGTLALP